MAKARRQWQWQPPRQSPSVHQVFAGMAINPCPICGAVGCTISGTKRSGFKALCVGCKAGTAPCSTPFNALRVYQATRASV